MTIEQAEQMIEPPINIDTSVELSKLDILKACQGLRKRGLSCRKQLKQYLLNSQRA